MQGFNFVCHIAGMAVSFALGLILGLRLLRKFDYCALFGLVVAYVYIVEGIVYIVFDPFSYMFQHDKHEMSDRSHESLIAPAAATIASLETVAVVVVAVNLLHLGSSYHRTESPTNLIYWFAIGAAVTFSLFLTPRVLMYLGYFVYGYNIKHNPIIAYWIVDSILELVTYALAFAYTFLPILRVLYKGDISLHTIGVYRMAEAMWYAHVFLLYLIQHVAVHIASPLAPRASIWLNSVRVAMGSLIMFVLALPAPRFFAESFERAYTSRFAATSSNVMQAPTPKNAIRVTFVDGDGKHMSASHQGTHGSVLTVPVILASKNTIVRS